MRKLAMVFLLYAAALHADPVSRPKHKRLRWLRRIGAAEVSLAEKVSAIRLKPGAERMPLRP